MQQFAHSSIYHLSHPDIVRSKNIPRVICSVCMLLGGAILFFLSFRVETKISLVPMCLLAASIALILIAIYRLFWKSQQFVYVPDHRPLRECSVFLDHKMLGNVRDLMDSHRYPVDQIDSVSKGMYYLVSLISKDRKFAALQLFLFVQYTYTPLTDVCFFYGDEVELLAGL